MSWLAIVVLAAGTYVFRIVGPIFRHRLHVPVRVEQLLSDASVVLLVGLVANSTLISNGGFAGWSRVIGVAVGGALALLNLPGISKLVAGRFPGRPRRRPKAAANASQRPPSGRDRSRRQGVHIPFPVVIIAAAAVTAALRLCGVS
jgi:branched-subunit amino acid transport protein